MRRRILVVDDDPFTYEDILAYFPEHDVERAYHGPKAIEMLQSRTYDVMLVDGRMPCLTGPELLQELRGNHPPAIGMSWDDGLLEELRTAGCIAVFPKPLIRRHVQAVLDQLPARPSSSAQSYDAPCGPQKAAVALRCSAR